jgi:hypothetical protein
MSHRAEQVGEAVCDLGCVKTRARQEGAELFSLWSSFDSIAGAVGFKIDETRDEISTRKFGF